MKNTQEILKQRLGNRLKNDVILAPYSTFKVGGPAEFYTEVSSEEEFIEAVKAAHEASIDVRVLGGISNVVVRHEGVKGLVIRNMYSQKKLLSESEDAVELIVTSGYSMTRLAKETAEDGYDGFAYHFKLPGTLGGALYMNSKWTAHPPTVYTGDYLESAKLLTLEGETKTVTKDYFEFDYDYSILQKTKEIVLEATFTLPKKNPEDLKRILKEVQEYRERTQPHGIPSSGCFFKNYEGMSAGKLIDEVGLKGYSINGAQVSDVHANFIVNTGNATEEDVLALVDHIKKTVKADRGITLEEEVIIV